MTGKRLRYMAVIFVAGIIATSSTPVFASNGSTITDGGLDSYSKTASMLSLAPAQRSYVSATVKSIGMDGNTINGLWTVVKSGSTTVAQGYTPLTFSARIGAQYSVSMANYQNYRFDHWQDGDSSSTRVISPTQPLTIVGVYRTSADQSAVTLSVSSISTSGSEINGLWTVVDSNGQTLSTGFTPVSYKATAGKTYTVTVSDYGQYKFDHWEGGSTSRSVEITPAQSTSLRAYYIVGSQAQPKSVAISVSSLSVSGSEINGLWTVVDSNGQTLSTGFTPFEYTATTGSTYTVTMADYQNFVFDHWENGSKSRTMELAPSQNVALKAYYNTSATTTQPPVQPTSVTLSVSSVSASGSEINGLWTVIDSNGQTLSTGYTPVSYTAASGKEYTITVADYGQYAFDHWEGGSTSRSMTITPTSNTALKAYYKVSSAPVQPPAQPPSNSDRSGVIVPLYTYPGETWDRVIAAKQAHPNVPIAVILNPANGPGGSADANYVNYINKMKSAGIITLGYVCTRYAGIQSYGYNCPNWDTNAVNADSQKWKNWYNVDGIFFDEMANWGGSEWFYTNINNYAKSIGLSYTVGNPGTDTSSSYVGTVDNIIIYESGGYPSASQIAGWHASYSKSNWGVLPMASWLDTNAVKSYIPYAKWIGVSPSWNTLPSFFENLVAALD